MLLLHFVLFRFAFMWVRLYGVGFMRVPFLGLLCGHVLGVLSSAFLWIHHMPCKPLRGIPLCRRTSLLSHSSVSGRASLMAQLVRNPPAICEARLRSLGWDDPLEKGKAVHSSVLVWRVHGLCSPWGRKESDTTEPLSRSLSVDI